MAFEMNSTIIPTALDDTLGSPGAAPTPAEHVREHLLGLRLRGEPPDS